MEMKNQLPRKSAKGELMLTTKDTKGAKEKIFSVNYKWRVRYGIWRQATTAVYAFDVGGAIVQIAKPGEVVVLSVHEQPPIPSIPHPVDPVKKGAS